MGNDKTLKEKATDAISELEKDAFERGIDVGRDIAKLRLYGFAMSRIADDFSAGRKRITRRTLQNYDDYMVLYGFSVARGMYERAIEKLKRYCGDNESYDTLLRELCSAKEEYNEGHAKLTEILAFKKEEMKKRSRSAHQSAR